MPAAYRPPEQIYADPLGAYTRGKAIRTQQKAAEQAIEFNDLKMEVMRDELENAPSERERARQFAEKQMELMTTQIDGLVREGSMAELELNAKLLLPALEDYNNTKNDPEALQKFNDAMESSILPNMSEESRQRYLKVAGEDHKFDHKEINLAGLGVRAFIEHPDRKLTETEFIGDDGKAYVGSYDPITGAFTDGSGRRHYKASPIANMATQEDLQGAAGGTVLANKIREQIFNTENLLDELDYVAKQIEDADQSGLGLAGDIGSGVHRAVEAGKGLANLVWPKGGSAYVESDPDKKPGTYDPKSDRLISEDELLSASLYLDVFEEAGVTKAAIQTNAIGIAYALARAANPDGRISDADVRHQLHRLNLDKSSKSMIRASIDEVKRSQLVQTVNMLETAPPEVLENPQIKAYYKKYQNAVTEIYGEEGEISNFPWLDKEWATYDPVRKAEFIEYWRERGVEPPESAF